MRMSPPALSLQGSWTCCLTALGCPPASAQQAFAGLVQRYSTPDRHYHTLEHIRAMLAVLHRLHPDPLSEPALLLAVWLHDVIYDTHAADNEERSAAFARTLLGGLSVAEPVLAQTERLILLTKRHQAEPDDVLGQVLLDADLAILGASATEYDRYAQAIRREYAWVADADYRQGRARVLEQFLGRPTVYCTPLMRQEAEAQARQNLQRERAGLLAS
jgi:predicted metal-dependent HD superfamily phosphohydrolase